MTPFRRDGHLTDLALEHTLDGASLEGADAHLSTCHTCADRLQAARAVELPDLRTMPASVQPLAALPAPANRGWYGLVGLLVAAVALFAALPLLRPTTGPSDGIRLRGDGLSLQVFRDAGEISERLRDGDPVAPGDRLGFRVRNRDAGHLLILGLDDAGGAYLCYPQGGGGSSVEVRPSGTPRTLPEAVRMDEQRGTERLFAVLCEEPFALDAVIDPVSAGETPPGCAVDGITLVKP
jgi:hypothetical protein